MDNARVTQFIYKETTGSTNDDLLEMACEGAEHGTVVCAGHQERGRGRRGRVWLDSPGMSALFSVLIREADVRLLQFVGMIGALAVLEVLEERFGLSGQVKWPNDVLVAGRKIAGVLAEADKSRTTLAVGIGINVNQEAFEEDLLETATSMLLCSGRTHDSTEISRLVSAKVLDIWQKLVDHGGESLISLLNGKLYGKYLSAVVEAEGEIFECTIDRVDNNGCLAVVMEDGSYRFLVVADSIILRHSNNNSIIREGI